jgi:hypothetical protein
MLPDMFKDAPAIDFSSMVASAPDRSTKNLESQETPANVTMSCTTTPGSRKRGSTGGTKSTADSPMKMAQAPMSPSPSINPKRKKNLFNSIFGKITAAQDYTRKTLTHIVSAEQQRKQEALQTHSQCLALAKEAGIDCGSEMYYFITKHLKDETNMAAFLSCDTNEARMGWI